MEELLDKEQKMREELEIQLDYELEEKRKLEERLERAEVMRERAERERENGIEERIKKELEEILDRRETGMREIVRQEVRKALEERNVRKDDRTRMTEGESGPELGGTRTAAQGKGE